MVIESHPRLDDGTPFPTLFWLTCPVLLKRVSRIEAAGAALALTDTFSRAGAARRRLEEALDAVAARRDAHEVIEDPGAPPGGGPDRIKCLHAHTAIELAGIADPVGSITLAHTEWPDCRVACAQVSPAPMTLRDPADERAP